MTVKRVLMIMSAAVVALVTACGGSTHSAKNPPASTPSAPATAQSSAPQTTGSGGSGSIPQGGGGDHDADNSGGPSDGDGNV
jgi:hypothetical protein